MLKENIYKKNCRLYFKKYLLGCFKRSQALSAESFILIITTLLIRKEATGIKLSSCQKQDQAPTPKQSGKFTVFLLIFSKLSRLLICLLYSAPCTSIRVLCQSNFQICFIFQLPCPPFFSHFNGSYLGSFWNNSWEDSAYSDLGFRVFYSVEKCC